MTFLNQSVQYIKGVGPSRVTVLNKLGIQTVEDVINYFPREYEDRGKFKSICELQNGEVATIKAVVKSNITESRIRKGMTIYKTVASDETDSIILTWFNQMFVKKSLKPLEEYIFYGKVNAGIGRKEMSAPIFERPGENKNLGKIVPIYPLTEGITQNVLRGIIQSAVDMVKGNLEETLPSKVINDNNLCDINYAIEKIHFPVELSEFEIARHRIAFEELLIMQLGLLSIKAKGKKDEKGISFASKGEIDELLNSLPYKLTGAQMRVWKEIEKDMEKDRPMNRLVQGDVGSGKTVVATLAMLKAVNNGYQAAMMAPTAILAKQHYLGISKMLAPFGIRCELFTSDLTKSQKNKLLQSLKAGEIDIAIGTHALLEENVEFNNCGLVITDEQHRFGVRQRGILTAKGEKADTLVMTATPIPRTLAIILYGDLDISIIDELPPGRQKIDTYAVKRNLEERVNNFVIKELASGRQAYIVCPLVEESENFDAKSVTEMFDYYKDVFKDYKVAILHGKMKPKEKDEIMAKFKDGEINVLISTTVIEVGVDVPNATIMIIENAERFGLAQLHQLRGRVGRGKFKSYCILKYESNSEIVKQRMEIMQKSSDGFVISEKDLELRGPGEFFGTKQHGIPEFKVANLITDVKTLKEAQAVANDILETDPMLLKEENQKIKQKIDKLFDTQIQL